MRRDVLVTGVAWETALGSEPDAVWARLLAGETGLRVVPSAHRLRNVLAAPVVFPPAGWDPARRQVALALRTVGRALDDAGLLADAGDPLLVLGTSYGAHLDDNGTGGLDDWVTAVATQAGFRRPPVSLSTACSSGSDAIMTAGLLVAAGAEDVCICGGVDILTDAKRLGHTALGTMSPTMLRAFDRRRDGTLLGEGAAVMVIEEAERARRRGAAAHAVFRGGGSSNDAAGMTAPDTSGTGVVLAIQRSLDAAGLGVDDVAVINAHGSGTPANDAVEALSFGQLFANGRRPIVFATKGAFGHTLGATGAIEAVALVLGLRHQQVPPVYGLDEVASDLTLPIPVGSPARLPAGPGISLTLGFGGFNTSLVFEAMPDVVG